METWYSTEWICMCSLMLWTVLGNVITKKKKITFRVVMRGYSEKYKEENKWSTVSHLATHTVRKFRQYSKV